MDRSRISTRSFSLSNQRVLSDPSLSFNRSHLPAASHQHSNSDVISTRYIATTVMSSESGTVHSNNSDVISTRYMHVATNYSDVISTRFIPYMLATTVMSSASGTPQEETHPHQAPYSATVTSFSTRYTAKWRCTLLIQQWCHQHHINSDSDDIITRYRYTVTETPSASGAQQQWRHQHQMTQKATSIYCIRLDVPKEYLKFAVI